MVVSEFDGRGVAQLFTEAVGVSASDPDAPPQFVRNRKSTKGFNMRDLPFTTDPAGRAAAEDAYAKAWGASAAAGAVQDETSSSGGDMMSDGDDLITSSESADGREVQLRITEVLAKQAAREGLRLELFQIVRLAASVTADLQLQKYWGVIGDETLLGVYPNAETAVQGLGLAHEENTYEAIELRTHYASGFEPLNAADSALAQVWLNPANDVPGDQLEGHSSDSGTR